MGRLKLGILFPGSTHHPVPIYPKVSPSGCDIFNQYLLRLQIVLLEHLRMASESPFGSKLPWVRYWSPRSKSLPGSGFFSLPSDFFGNESQSATVLEEILPQVGPLVLCGEPALGKTSELESFISLLTSTDQQQGALISTRARLHDSFIEFSQFLSNSPQWITWQGSGGILTLLIDGIDEGMIRIPLFVEKLSHFLGNIDASRLRLILCCRTAEWPDSEGNSLFSLWANEKQAIYDLQPLTREDARIAAEERGHDGSAFLNAVHNAGVESLAARPLTLLFLLDEFVGGRFKTTSYRQLYENGCRRFCEEPNTVRLALSRHQPSAFASSKEKLAAAKRLASLFLLGGKSALHRPQGSMDSTPSSSLRILEAAESQGEVTEQALSDVLNTGLFSSSGPSTFGFTHQTFAECLAGQELAALPIRQLRSLLCSRDARGEHVIPQLAELASWIAGYREEFFEYLSEIDPGILLRSDVSLVNPKLKSRLVARILELAARDEFFDEYKYNRFWRGLDHPSLPEQLKAVLGTRSTPLMARRVAMSIAEGCQRAELVSILWQILDDHDEDAQLRTAAAEALCASMPSDRLEELEPLAKGEVGPDPNLSIRGYALKRLVPERWSVSQALPCVGVPPNSRHFGSYHSTIEYLLPKHIKDSDLVPCLKAITKWKGGFSTLSHRRKFSMKVLLRGLEKIDEPEIQIELVKLWRAKSRNYRDFFSEGKRGEDGLEQASNNSRLKWASAVLNDSSTNLDDDLTQIVWESYRLVKPEDFEWVLHQLHHQPKNRLKAWARLAALLRDEIQLTKHWDLFIETLEQVPALREEFAWLKPVEIDSPGGRSAKANWLCYERRMGRARKKRTKPDPEEWIARELESIRNGETNRFIALCVALRALPGQTMFYETSNLDITKTPGWENASEDRKIEITAAAESFLLACSEKYEEVGGRSNYSSPGIAAIRLLRNRINHDTRLQCAIGTQWIDAIVGSYSDQADDCPNLFSLAYQLNPDESIRSWLREAKRDDENHGYLFAIRMLANCADLRLLQEVVNFVESLQKPKSIESGIKELFELDPTEASHLSVRLLEKFSTPATAAPDLLEAAIIGGLAIGSRFVWETSFPILLADDSLANRVLLEVSDDLDRQGEGLTRSLSEEQLADFYLILSKHFPSREDPDHKGGFVPPRQQVAYIRNGVMSSLASRGTPAACEQLLRLATTLPDEATWILWRYQDTLSAIRRTEWRPASVGDLIEILADGSKRFVCNDDDLMDLILESLSRYQKWLTSDDLPAVEELWHWEGGGQTRKNFRHRDEEAISDSIARWLRDDLGSSSKVVVNREVQPERGKKTDIVVQAWSQSEQGRSRSERPLSVTIEVKGCWNRGVSTAAKTQLLDDYLIPHGRTHGLYLIAWFHSPKSTLVMEGQPSCLRHENFQDAFGEVTGFVLAAASPGTRIEPFVLDARIRR